AQSRLEERDDHGDHADIEPAIGSERDDGQQGQGPRDGAVVLEREVEPAQEDDEEGGADEPAVSERGPGGAPEGGGEGGHQPQPGEKRPSRDGEGGGPAHT